MDVEIETIVGQIGTAILEKDGTLVKSTGELTSPADENLSPVRNIYKILKDTAKCLDEEPLKRISIEYEGFAYVVTIDDRYIYIIKKSTQ